MVNKIFIDVDVVFDFFIDWLFFVNLVSEIFEFSEWGVI